MLKVLGVSLGVIVAFAALGYFMILGVGKPIGSDLSIVGKGRPALVMAYENFSPDGGEALNRLRAIRSDYDAQLDFVIADLGTPQGREFASRHEIGDSQAVFLLPNGEPLQRTVIAHDEQELRQRLDAKLAAVK